MADEQDKEGSKMSRVDQEIEAIKTVLAALESLEADVRSNVLEYVLKRLKLHQNPDDESKRSVRSPFLPAPQVADVDPVHLQRPVGESGSIHIKAFKDQKKPKSAIEMAALVAYYLDNLAAPAERKKTIDTKDIDTQFKIAEFPLPGQLRFTLPNAKVAGYFDAAGEGAYRLNAVGHNLVVHSMPRDGVATKKTASRTKKAKTKRKSR